MIQTFSSTIRRKEMDAVLTCMVEEKTGPGELNVRFIQTLKEQTGFDGAVAFRSPVVALSYALKAFDLEAGSSIMISALAPSWQYRAVESLGYKPLVLDVREEDGLVPAENVRDGMTKGGRILLYHESNGILGEIDKILELGVPVIEDISHSYGAVFPENTENDEFGESSAQKSSADSKKKKKVAGSAGTFAIMCLEEFDTITGGGGAVIAAPLRRDWTVLKKYTDTAPRTEILPDINSALAYVQLKEFARNEEARKNLFSVFQRSLLSGRNKTFVREPDNGSTVWSFPVVLGGSFKDAKQYAARKEIEITQAYSDSVISLLDELESAEFKTAKSLYLRTALFPLYPRLGAEAAKKIAKVLGTLP